MKLSGRSALPAMRGLPELAAEFERTQKGELKAGWEKAIPSFCEG